MSEQNKAFQELEENDLEQVSGAALPYLVGDGVVCVRGIKWKIIEIVAMNGYLRCKAIEWPEFWNEWIETLHDGTAIINPNMIVRRCSL